MAHEVKREHWDELVFQVGERLNFSSDEWLMEVMQGVSIDYSKGYLESFLANASDEDIRLLYQLARLINMAFRSQA